MQAVSPVPTHPEFTDTNQHRHVQRPHSRQGCHVGEQIEKPLLLGVQSTWIDRAGIAPAGGEEGAQPGSATGPGHAA